MNPERGTIYLMPFGQGKERPVVVVSRDHLNTGDYAIVVPFTTQQLDHRKNFRHCVFFRAGEGRHAGEGGLNEDCVAKTDEITRVLKTEINWREGRIGRLTEDQMKRIVRAIRHTIRDGELT